MKIEYLPAALSDIRSTVSYIRDKLQNPAAASKLAGILLHSISLLKENPYLGVPLNTKIDTAPDTIRFLVVSRQIVFYRITADTITIIRVLDSRMDYLTVLSF